MDSDGSQEQFRAIQNQVRQRLAAGALPFGTGHVSAVPRGSGAQCVVCDASVDPEQVACEIEHFGEGPQRTTVTVHVACYWLWRVETLRLVADRLPENGASGVA